MQKEKPKVTYSLAFQVAFLAVENENQQPEDLPQADLAVYLRDLISSVGKDKVNTWEFCILQLHPLNCCICNYSTLFFTLILGDSALYDYCSGIVDRFVSFIITSLLFLSVKDYCVNIINKIIQVACRPISQLVRGLTSKLSSWTLKGKFHIYAHLCVILYLMYLFSFYLTVWANLRCNTQQVRICPMNSFVSEIKSKE